MVLDNGTDNRHIINSLLYLGSKHPRVRGKEYEDFVDKFVKTAKRVYPDTYIHFEVERAFSREPGSAN